MLEAKGIGCTGKQEDGSKCTSVAAFLIVAVPGDQAKAIGAPQLVFVCEPCREGFVGICKRLKCDPLTVYRLVEETS